MLEKYLCPTLRIDRVSDIDLNWLEEQNIKFILLDVDNTISYWLEEDIEPDIANWIDLLKKKNFKISLLSNSDSKRLRKISNRFDITAISWSCKPFSFSFYKALRTMGAKDASQAIVIGDQMFTDVLGGNKIGAKTIWTKSLSSREFIATKAVRFLEKFFTKIFEKKSLMPRRNCYENRYASNEYFGKK